MRKEPDVLELVIVPEKESGEYQRLISGFVRLLPRGGGWRRMDWSMVLEAAVRMLQAVVWASRRSS
jgi:hypothetical protein